MNPHTPNQPTQPDQPGSVAYLVRASGYSATSFFSLFAGILIADLTSSHALLLIGTWSLCFPFFLCYAVCTQAAHKIDSIADLAKQQRDALIISIGFGICLAVISVLLYKIKNTTLPSTAHLIVCAEYAFASLLYGGKLYREYRSPLLDAPIRHELLWPVVVSISLPLYFSVYLDELATGLLAHVPLLLLLLGYILSERLRWRAAQSALAGLVVFFSLTVVSAFDLIPLEHLRTLLSLIGFAAYLATFESWSVTSEVSRKRLFAKGSFDYSASSTRPRTKSYYVSTMHALSLSTLLSLLLYPFTRHGIVLFLGLSAHSILAFILWYKAGGNLLDLHRQNWRIYKLFFGFTFLALLVVDASFPLEPAMPVMTRFVGWDGLAALFTFIAIFTGTATRSAFTAFRRFGVADRVIQPRCYLLGIPVCSLILCTIILIVADNTTSQVTLAKLHQSFIMYSVFIVLSVLGFLIRTTSTPPRQPATATTLTPGASTAHAPEDQLPEPEPNATPRGRTIWPLLEIARPMTSGLAGTTTALVLLFDGYGLIPSVLHSLPIVLIAMTSFIANDIFDKYKDAFEYRRNKSLATGIVPVRLALGALLALSLLVVAISFVYPIRPRIALLALLALAYLYTPWAHLFAWSKGLYAAALIISPLFFASLVGGVTTPIFYYLAIFVFAFGRETLLDVLDLEVDRRSSLRTLPSLLGSNVAYVGARFLMVLGSGLLLGFAQGAAATLAALLALLLLLHAVRTASAPRLADISHLSMWLGAIAVAASLWRE